MAAWWVEKVPGVDVEAVREKALWSVKRFLVVKQQIWNSAESRTPDGQEIPKKDRTVDIFMLVTLLDEIKLL